ncbi:hypothetical protein [Pseudonocardia spinosispora]|nr:hypothetical protein [Pseudonocardia spinosispora]
MIVLEHFVVAISEFLGWLLATHPTTRRQRPADPGSAPGGER